MPTPPTETTHSLRQRAEEKLAFIKATNAEMLTPDEIQRLLHEFQVHQIELEMQNEELHSKIAEKDAIHALYIDLYECAPASYFNLGRDATIHAVNMTGADLLGVDRALLINNRLDAFISDETRPTFHEFLDKVFTSKAKETCEVALETERLSTLFIQIDAVVTESGKNCRSVVTDITRRKQAEKALKESEALYRSIGESIDYGVWVCEPDGRNIYASDSFLDMVGITQEQCSNFGWGDVLHPDDSEHTIVAWQECVRTGCKWDIEHRFRGSDGQWHYVLARGVPVRNEKGEIIKWAGINLDITDRKQAEEELVAAKQKIQSIIDNTPAIVYAFDLEERFVLANSAAAKLLNSTPPQMIGKRRHDFMPQTDADWHEANDLKVIEAGKALNFEEKSVLQGCSMVWLTTKFPLRDVAGKIYAIGGISTDITARKQAEEVLLRQSEAALHLSEQEFRTLAEAMPQIVWATLPDGWNIYFNQQWVDYTGLTMEESYGHGWNIPFHPDDKQRAWDAWQRATRNIEPYSLECRLRRADGVYRWWLIRGVPMRGENGEIFKWFGTCTDIEEIKLAEAELIDRSKELAATINQLRSEILERELAEKKLLEETTERLQATEALREKERMLIQQSRQAAMGEMIGNIAHQWRQPLNTLGLYTQRLGMLYGMPSFNKEFLDTSIAKSMEIIQHMSKTIDDFRNYFKPERHKTDFCLNEAIKSTISLLEGNLNNPKITIDLVEHDNPVIHGYQNEFAQVFLNILNNARDAIIERDINNAQVTISICSEDNCAVVTVADNAGGIPDEVISKVFDPYFTTKGPQVGTGIGLYMSKTIIEKNMGGRLTVRNTDTGAEFRIEVEHGTQN